MFPDIPTCDKSYNISSCSWRRSIRKRPRLEAPELEDQLCTTTSLVLPCPSTPATLLLPPVLPSSPATAYRRDLLLVTYKKLKSPLFCSRSPTLDNKENSSKDSCPSLARRRSSLFSPASLRHYLSRRGRVETRPSPTTPPCPPPTPPLVGQGRDIPLRQGHLWKRCGRLHWRKKYCVLLAHHLVYYPSMHAYLENLHGKQIGLQAVTVKVADMKEGRRPDGGDGREEATLGGVHALTIVSLTQQWWTFSCPSSGSLQAWVSSLQSGISVCLQGQAPHQAPVLDRLRHLAGNSQCADCRAPAPEWASVNLGILVCIECSGAHRSLGCHVSKVRSLCLDLVDDSSLAQLEAVGNRAAAEEWEARLEPGERPGVGASREEREAFVHRKYVQGCWRAEERLAGFHS